MPIKPVVSIRHIEVFLIPCRPGKAPTGVFASISPALMKFVPFALLFIFSATFFSLWIMDRARQYLLWFSLSFLAFASAALSQLLIPLGPGVNTIASAVLYVSGALL